MPLIKFTQPNGIAALGGAADAVAAYGREKAAIDGRRREADLAERRMALEEQEQGIAIAERSRILAERQAEIEAEIGRLRGAEGPEVGPPGPTDLSPEEFERHRELASRMSPEGARQYIADVQRDLAEAGVRQSYNQAMTEWSRALQSGALGEDEGVTARAQEVLQLLQSEQIDPAQAQQFLTDLKAEAAQNRMAMRLKINAMEFGEQVLAAEKAKGPAASLEITSAMSGILSELESDLVGAGLPPGEQPQALAEAYEDLRLLSIGIDPRRFRSKRGTQPDEFELWEKAVSISMKERGRFDKAHAEEVFEGLRGGPTSAQPPAAPEGAASPAGAAPATEAAEEPSVPQSANPGVKPKGPHDIKLLARRIRKGEDPVAAADALGFDVDALEPDQLEEVMRLVREGEGPGGKPSTDRAEQPTHWQDGKPVFADKPEGAGAGGTPKPPAAGQPSHWDLETGKPVFDEKKKRRKKD